MCTGATVEGRSLPSIQQNEENPMPACKGNLSAVWILDYAAVALEVHCTALAY